MFTEIADFYQEHKTAVLIGGGVIVALLLTQYFRGAY